MPEKINKLVFIYSIEEAEHYIADGLNSQESCICIAMTPVVRAYLKIKGVDARDTSQYFTKESHVKAMALSGSITGKLEEQAVIADKEAGIKEAYTGSFIFWAREAANTYIWMIEAVANAVRQHGPKVLVAGKSVRRPVLSMYVMPDEKTLGFIVEKIAQKEKLDFVDLSEKKNDDMSLKSCLDRASMLKEMVFKYLRFSLWHKWLSLSVIFDKRPVVFFTAEAYQMAKLQEECRRDMPEVSFHVLKSAVLIPMCLPDVMINIFCSRSRMKVLDVKKLFTKLAEDIEREKDFFSYRGVSFSDSLAKKIGQNIAGYILSLIAWSTRIDDVVKTIKPIAVISSGTRPDDILIAELAGKHGIKDILVSHGSHVNPTSEEAAKGWGEHGTHLLRAPFSHVAYQSPLASEYHKFYPTPAKGVPTGPLIWGKPVDRSRCPEVFKKLAGPDFTYGKTRVVVHAGTPKPTNFLRFHVYETPDEYLSAMCDLARACEGLPDTICIIKFRPSREITESCVRTLLPLSKQVILSVTDSFNDVLGLADLLVSFSSTTIEEALQNNVPVLLYGGEGRYKHMECHEVAPLFDVPANPVYHVGEKGNLRFAINAILEHHKKELLGLFDKYKYSHGERKTLADVIRDQCKESA